GWPVLDGSRLMPRAGRWHNHPDGRRLPAPPVARGDCRAGGIGHVSSKPAWTWGIWVAGLNRGLARHAPHGARRLTKDWRIGAVEFHRPCAGPPGEAGCAPTDTLAVHVSAPVDSIAVARDEAGMRLDRWFRVHFPHVTYGHLQKLLRSGQVRLNSRRVQGNARLEEGQQVPVPAMLRQAPQAQASIVAPLILSKSDRDFIEALILYEDDHVLVLNKPYGIAVQGGTGTKRHLDGMLAGMVDRFGDRPRLVHRLD